MLPEIFGALAQDMARAMADAAEAETGFIEQTAVNEDTALQRIADTEAGIAKQASGIGAKAGQDAAAARSAVGFRGRVSDDQLTNALRDWQSERFQFGNQQFLLDRGDFGHILSRHMPELWDGSLKAEQTFFDSGMSISDIQDAIRNVLEQNRDTLISRGTNAIYQIQGSFGGTDYIIGVNNGHIAQFFPLPRS
ncbi:MAG TPA: hypothetical protein VGS19_28810 [Streptosporangiaceae bacterium]|nr:hypothetical protein [Streptosporangiaceae bacterium]